MEPRTTCNDPKNNIYDDNESLVHSHVKYVSAPPLPHIQYKHSKFQCPKRLQEDKIIHASYIYVFFLFFFFDVKDNFLNSNLAINQMPRLHKYKVCNALFLLKR
jgi:hypothetical protein